MKRKKFIVAALAALPMLANANVKTRLTSNPVPFKVAAGKSRFGDVVRFMGVHPTDLKVSSKDTDGQLSIFEYTGLDRVGPPLHIHFDQDEIFIVSEGEYRFVVGDQTQILKAGDTMFLPRNIPHTWLQLTQRGKLLYFMQPAGKMEEFFKYMNDLKSMPSTEELDKIHKEHGMKVLGPPLKL